MNDNVEVRPSGLVVPKHAAPAPKGLYVPQSYIEKQRQRRPVGIDLFCGAGGFSLGMMQAGIEVVAAVEWDAGAALTYMYNLGSYPIQIHYIEPEDEERLERATRKTFTKTTGKGKNAIIEMTGRAGMGWGSGHSDVPGVSHFFFGDARKLTGERILNAIGMEKGEVMCVFGGPPCQGFSRAGSRNVMDPRNSLVFEFARLVLEIWPATICMENVPDIATMLTPEGVPVMDAFCMMLERGNYGNYDRLRTSLVGQPNRRAAVRTGAGDDAAEQRTKRKKKKVAKKPARQPSAPEQLALL